DWDDSIAKTVRGGQQMCQYARFVEGMAAVVDQVEAGIRPCLVQLPRGARGRAGVVAALDDGAWNAAQPMRVAQQLAFLQKAAIHEVVVFDAREGQRRGVIGMRKLMFAVGQERDGVALPLRP